VEFSHHSKKRGVTRKTIRVGEIKIIGEIRMEDFIQNKIEYLNARLQSVNNKKTRSLMVERNQIFYSQDPYLYENGHSSTEYYYHFLSKNTFDSYQELVKIVEEAYGKGQLKYSRETKIEYYKYPEYGKIHKISVDGNLCFEIKGNELIYGDPSAFLKFDFNYDVPYREKIGVDDEDPCKNKNIIEHKNEFTDKELLQSIYQSQYSLGDITQEILLSEFSDCYVYQYTVSFENYGTVFYLLTSKAVAAYDENYKNDDSVNSANAWGGEKIKICDIGKDALCKITQDIKILSLEYRFCPECNSDDIERCVYDLRYKSGYSQKCKKCGYETFDSFGGSDDIPIKKEEPIKSQTDNSKEREFINQLIENISLKNPTDKYAIAETNEFSLKHTVDKYVDEDEDESGGSGYSILFKNGNQVLSKQDYHYREDRYDLVGSTCSGYKYPTFIIQIDTALLFFREDIEFSKREKFYSIDGGDTWKSYTDKTFIGIKTFVVQVILLS
jgi:predicted RNA-binding Zn-ribbon protein involved in translation (DUF1610 family)